MGIALLVILGLIGLVLGYILIVFLFTNMFTSRVFSIGFSIASIVLASKLSSGDNPSLNIPYFICTVLTCLFLIGPVVFDTEQDGWILGEDGVFRPNIVGGFLANVLITGAIVFISMLFAGEASWVYFLLPLISLLINVIFVVVFFKNR